MIYECEQCGTNLSPGALNCPKCGDVFKESVPQDAEVPRNDRPEDKGRPSRINYLVGSIVLLFLLTPIGLFGLNYSNVQSPMNEVLASDQRNQGIKVSVHYENYINRSDLIYDMTDVAGTNSEIDVFRVLSQFADKMQNTNFKRVEVAFRGKVKFLIPGDYFQKIGKERASQNPVYTIRTFPENVLTPTGNNAFQHWEGGFLGVDLKQLQDFNDFHAKWWKDDISSSH